MATDRFLSNLGLARRAGALVIGCPAVLEAVRHCRAALVLYAEDLSAGALKKLQTACAHYQVQLRSAERTMAQLSDALGKSCQVGAVALTPTTFLHLFQQ